MEDPTFWVQTISTLGFPIIACFGMYYLCNKVLRDLQESIKSLEGKLDSLIQAFINIKND